MLADGYILNLNRYRGLQVIDITDVTQPVQMGRLQLVGTPVEMYVVGDRAVVLMNGARDYHHNGAGLDVAQTIGAAVLLVDISDRTAPRVISEARVPGGIKTSRLARQGNQTALYVAASEWGMFQNENGYYEWRTQTIVKSFDVVPALLIPRTELNLGGYVSAIHAESEVLLVARAPRNWWDEHTSISVIDISSKQGEMVLRDTVTVDGYVRSQFHMDFRSGMLRVFSGPRWGGGTSHLQTWDASNLDDLRGIDEEDFGQGQAIFGAVFLDHSAFAVTYLRSDPFHAFSIEVSGEVEERSEFVVSAWNYFFRPVLNNKRLIGIGVNDENGRKLAVSLYDITNLSNPDPLVERAEVGGVDGSWDWSEANWDHRAFTVLDNAVSVQALNGQVETGLVLLPFSSWGRVNGQWQYQSAVQIFTFSRTTLTRRGVMAHGSPVRRTFRPEDGLAANLSDQQLRLYDQSTLDAPAELGRLDLAPDYGQLVSFGAYRARLKYPSNGYWYYDPGAQATVEIIPGDVPADFAQPVASFQVPPDTQIHKLGDRLMTMNKRVVSYWPYTLETTLRVYDLSTPQAPQQVGGMTTASLPSASTYYWGSKSLRTLYVLDDTVVFLRPIKRVSWLGRERSCFTRIQQYVSCMGEPGCTYSAGDQRCRSFRSGPTFCNGGFASCTDLGEGETTCTPAALGTLPGSPRTYCSELNAGRMTLQFELTVLDLSQPDSPVTNTLTLPVEDDGVSLLPHGNDLYVTVKQPVVVPGDPRTYAHYFVKRIDLSNPSQPVVGPAINVPGELIAVQGDTFYTRDKVWGAQFIETAIAAVQVADGVASLQSYHHFADRNVSSSLFDQSGLAVVTHLPVSSPYYAYQWKTQPKLSLLTPQDSRSGSYQEQSQSKIPTWMTLRQVTDERAFFVVPGGVLMADIDRPARPEAESFMPINDWYSAFQIEEDQLLAPARTYGIHEYDLDDPRLRLKSN